jgi:hypothetical protein
VRIEVFCGLAISGYGYLVLAIGIEVFVVVGLLLARFCVVGLTLKTSSKASVFYFSLLCFCSA